MLARSVPIALTACALAGSAAFAAGGEPRRAHTAADTRLARSLVLRRADFPAGWTANPAAMTAARDFGCPSFRADLSDLVETGRADSPSFDRGDHDSISSVAIVFRTAADARAAFDRLFRPALLRCLRRPLSTPGSPLRGRVLAARAGPLGGLGTRAWSARLRVRYRGAGVSLDAGVDFVFVQARRALAGLVVFRDPPPVDERLASRLAHVVAARVRA